MQGLLLLLFAIVAAMMVANYINKARERQEFIIPGASMPSPWMITGVIAAIVIVALILFSIIIVQPGEALVNFNIFRGLDHKAKPEGIYLINPVTNRRFIYSIRSQIYTMSGMAEEGEIIGDDAVKVLSADGLEILLDVTVRYRPDIDILPELHRRLGPTYALIAIRPKLREALRTEFAKYEATETFSIGKSIDDTELLKDIVELVSPSIGSTDSDTEADEQPDESMPESEIPSTESNKDMEVSGGKRAIIQENLNDILRSAFAEDGIILDEFLLRNIVLPTKVRDAIEEKKSAQQEAERMVYILAKESQEAERKKIEAGGQAAAIEIVAKTLRNNPVYMQWYAIDKLNPNAELVITDGKTILNLDSMRE